MKKELVPIAFGLVLLASFSISCNDVDSGDEQLAASETLPLQISSSEISAALEGQIFTVEHMVELEPDVELHLIEKFTIKSLLDWPKRSVLMMPPTLVNNNFYDAQIEGDDSFNVLDRMALEGYFAFAVSYEGYGQSSLPLDGRDVTFERTLEQMGRLVELIRRARWTPKIDLVGGSLGSYLAIALGGIESPIPHHHIGHVVLTSIPYRSFSPFVSEFVFNDELEELLSSIPYVETGPEGYGLVLMQAVPAASDWGFATFPGVYATGPTLEAFDLPVHPAQNGSAPALVIWGDADPMHTAEDVDALVSEYGGSIELLVTEGGGHSPLFEPAREIVWDRIGEFLDFD